MSIHSNGGSHVMPQRHSNSVPSTIARSLVGALLASALLAGTGTPAQAGRGGSPQGIATAIHSGSADAIKSELERAEYLVCVSCVDLVVPLIDSNDASVREAAGWWLVRRGTGRQIFADMLGRLAQPNSLLARNAADVLASFRYPQAIPALGAALSNPLFDGEARAAMARALGVIRRPAAAAYLMAVLSDSEPQVRAAALSALRKVEGFGTHVGDGSVAIPLLSDPDADVRTQAILTVAERRTTAAAPQLVTLLQTDPQVTVRKNAAWALGEVAALASVAGQPLSHAAIADSSPLVRSLARIAITGLAP